MQDIVRDLTERFVKYLDTPKEERKKEQETPKRKEPWTTLWFGMVPTACRMWVDQKRNRRARSDKDSNVKK